MSASESLTISQNLAKNLAIICICGLAVASVCAVSAQERRARPPKFTPDDFRGVFFDDVSEVVGKGRPSVNNLKAAASVPVGSTSAVGVEGTRSPESVENSGGDEAKWRGLADASDLEDEIKRLKMDFDELITTPGRFKSGDYRVARQQMFTMAAVLAVISEYEGDIRFKKDAGAARDALARSAVNLTGDAFAEAKQRKADLQDLVGGGGVSGSNASQATDWSKTATRTALMKYLDQLQEESLKSGANDPDAVKANKTKLKRAAGMVAVVAQILNEEGMDEAEDGDYRTLSEAMKSAALELRLALQQDDADKARLAVGAIGQSCTACHEQYR